MSLCVSAPLFVMLKGNFLIDSTVKLEFGVDFYCVFFSNIESQLLWDFNHRYSSEPLNHDGDFRLLGVLFT